MELKLKEAQSLLSGLTTNDFDQMKNSIQNLENISLKAQVQHSTSPRYNLFSEDFRYTLEQMQESAEEENVEGVTLGYMRMVMTCVECHSYIRETEEIASLPGKSIQSLINAM